LEFALLLLPNFFLLLLVSSLVAKQRINEQVYITHVVDPKTLADAVNLNCELFLQTLALTTLVRSVINQVASFFDKHFEYISDFLILLFSLFILISLTSSYLTLIINITARLMTTLVCGVV
jgi:hypothetical protein